MEYIEYIKDEQNRLRQMLIEFDEVINKTEKDKKYYQGQFDALGNLLNEIFKGK